MLAVPGGLRKVRVMDPFLGSTKDRNVESDGFDYYRQL